ncbi:hypothetical protein Q5M87_00705 [Brachyspira innocens]|uniref:Lipocalin-like domain-containing protein n=2 Tax=Brachyspira innocens TaxID=13264 RepID=A0ABT8YUV2_9SPIR|nr:hypothetical protein [Brachyspira innocens]MDO6992523.1 hypothetical protein [Brachyspira innocens]MDO7019672.1 hypothetical protein [Brachyspira innocens]
MLKKLLVLTLFVSFLAVGCDKLKEAAGNVTGTITGIESTYVGTWNADTASSSTELGGSYFTVKDDGSMSFYDRELKKTIEYKSTWIIKTGSTYTAIYNETDPNDDTVILGKYTVVITFEEKTGTDSTTTTTVANVSYRVEIEADKKDITYKGVFNKAQ